SFQSLACLVILGTSSSALIFETCWFARLEQLLGVGLFASATVVGCFMLGFALGALIAAYRGGSAPMRSYVWTQFLAAFFAALLSLFVFSNLPYAFGPWKVWALSVFMTVPACLVGMALPLMTAGLARYASNGVDAAHAVSNITCGASRLY